jgi:hypothetical protein
MNSGIKSIGERTYSAARPTTTFARSDTRNFDHGEWSSEANVMT